MSAIKRIFANSIASLANRLINPVASFVLVLMIAKKLGASYLGEFSSVLALLFIFESIASLGFPYLVTREVSQDRSAAGKYLINASVFGTLFSIVVAVFMCLTGFLIYDSEAARLSILLLSAALLSYPVTLVSQSICSGFERLHYITIPVIIGNLFKLTVGILFMKLGYGIVYVVGAIAFSYMIIAAISFLFAVKCIKKNFSILYRLDFNFVHLVIQATPIFALILILGTVRYNVDVLIVNKLVGAIEAGYYSAAFKLINILNMGVSCFIMALQPVIFKLFKISKEKFEVACIESIRYFYIGTIPIVFGTILLGDRFIALVYSPEFLPATKVLSILVFSIIIFSMNQMFANTLIAAGHQRINFMANLIGFACSIFFNFYLITIMGFVGAGIANVGAALSACVFQYWYFRKCLFKINFLGLMLKPLFASMIMCVCVYFTRNANLILVVSAAAIIYLAVLYIIKGSSLKQFLAFKKAIET